ncbi:MAG: carboxylate-amine ligase [Alphaproteobacteria bacterium]
MSLALTLGVEEEYLLVNLETYELAPEPPPELMEKLKAALGENVTGELYRSQIEVMTPVCTTVAAADRELRRLRRGVADICAEFGLAPMAASTHPLAAWRDQVQVHNERYDRLVGELGGIVSRYLICGLHVHLGVLDPDLRISVLQALRPFLPYFLAFTTSSPYWQGDDTRVKSYRLSVAHSLPRTGMPDDFGDFETYQRFVDVLIETGLVEDATVLWWDVRPSAKFPTLELRVCDACPRIGDALAIVALYQSLVSALIRTGEVESAGGVALPLIKENLWRAQRFGFDLGFLDYHEPKLISGPDMIRCLIDRVREDAERLECMEWLAELERLPERGTSADRQRRLYAQARDDGADHHEALSRIVRALVTETMEGC